MWIWYLDRGAALVAYATLWFAALTGVLHNARSFGALHETARKVHVPASVIACTTLLTHVGVGFYDTWLVVSGQVPHPRYSDAYLAAGIVVGLGALLLLVTSVLGFLDAKRFQRPWDPRTVHAFAYGGFVFATLHAVAIGTDMLGIVLPAVLAGTAFLAYVLALRAYAARGSGPATRRPETASESATPPRVQADASRGD